MPLRKNHIAETAICMTLIVINLTSNLLSGLGLIDGFAGVNALMYIAIYVLWIYSIRRRFISRDIRRNLTLLGALMICWTVMIAVKYDFVERYPVLNRYLWYAFYIPISFMPVLMFLSTLYLGKAESYRASEKWKWLYLPAAFISLGIMTNDYHQLAFCFFENGYSYGVLYYITVGFFALLVVGIFFAAFRACAKRQYRKYLWMPMVILAAGVVYWVDYITHINRPASVLMMTMSISGSTCLFAIAYWESLVLAHLIPSNHHHRDFFRLSSIDAGLTDRDYRVRLRAADSVTPAPQEIAAALSQPVALRDGALLLKSFPVQGGYFYWTENNEELQRLHRSLNDTKDYLTEEQAMLDAKNRLEEGRKRVEEQTRLYNIINQRIRPQLDRIDAMLADLPQDEAAFCAVMKRAAVLNVYIKRYANLILIGGAFDDIGSDELGMAIHESLDYVRLSGIACYADIEDGIRLNSEDALSAYALFEKALEAALPASDAVLVTLKRNADGAALYIEISSPAALIAAADASITAEDDVEYIRFQLHTGGGTV